MKGKTKILLFVVLIGLLLVAAGFQDSMLLIKGKSVDLNTASITDFEDGALAEGEIYFPVGLMVTYEETHKV